MKIRLVTVTAPERATTVMEKEETKPHEQDSNKESHGEVHMPPEIEVRGGKSSRECCYRDEIIEKIGEKREASSGAQ